MAKVSKRARLAYVTAAALGSTFIGSPAWANCVSQAPVDPKSIICDNIGANGWEGSSTDSLKVVVSAGSTVLNNQDGTAPPPALITTGATSSLINNSGNFNNGVGPTFGIDAGVGGAAIAVGGGSQVTNNANAYMRGTITFGSATGANTNILDNLYSNGGGNNLIGVIAGDVTSAGNTTINNGGIIGGTVTQTGAGTVTITNGVVNGWVTSLSGAPAVQNGLLGNATVAIVTDGSTTVTNRGGGGGAGSIINGSVTLGNVGNGSATGTSTLINGSSGSNATITGAVVMNDQNNVVTNDGGIAGNVTMNGGGTNTYNAGSTNSTGNNGLRLPGNIAGVVTGTLQGSTVAGSLNVLNLNGTSNASVLQAGSAIKGINTVNKNDSGIWTLRATLDGTAGALTKVNVNGGVLITEKANWVGSAATTVALADNSQLQFYGVAAGTFAGNIVDQANNSTGQVLIVGSGITTLSGNNTYQGITYIDGQLGGATLATGSNGALSANSAFLIYNGGTLVVNNNNTIKALDDASPNNNNANTVNLANASATLTVGSGDFGDSHGIIIGAGKLIKNTSGTLVLSNTSTNANTYTGGTDVLAGELQGHAGWGLQGNIAVSSGALVHFTGAANGTYAGALTGAGAVQVSDGTTRFTNTGNTYSGDTTIDEGARLRGGLNTFSPNSGVIANGTLDLDGDNTIKNLGGNSNGYVDVDGHALVLGGAGNYTFNGTIDGDGGSLTVGNGGGSWTMNGQTEDPFATFTNDGNTILNGGISATNGVNNGTLSGNGGFEGAFINNGTIRPGSSPGILEMVGSYGQSAIGTYVIDINGNNNHNNNTGPVAGDDYDQIAVSGTPGTASLAGAAVINQNGGQFVDGTVYHILTTSSTTTNVGDGQISGSFTFTNNNNVISSFITLAPSIVNDPVAHTGDYRLTVVRSNYNVVANNPNQAAVAGLTSGQGLQGLVGRPDADSAIAAIDNMSDDDAQAVFDQLSPEPYAAYVRALQDQGNLFTRQVAHRMAKTDADKDAKMGIWGNLYGQWGNGKNKSFRFGSDQDIKGGALGVDGTMGGNLTMGAAVGYSEAKVDYNLGNSKGKSKSWQVGGYASYHPGNVAAELQLAYIHGKVRAAKGVASGSGFSSTEGFATAHTSGNLFKVIGTVGYNLGGETLHFRPFVGVDFTTGKLKGFNEHGDLDALLLTVGRQKADRTDLLVGFKFSPDMGSLQPYADATLRYAIKRNHGLVHAAFDGLASDAFTVSGQRSAKMQGELDAGLAYSIGKSASIFFGYEGTLRKSLTEHGVNGGVKFAF